MEEDSDGPPMRAASLSSGCARRKRKRERVGSGEAQASAPQEAEQQPPLRQPAPPAPCVDPLGTAQCKVRAHCVGPPPPPAPCMQGQGPSSCMGLASRAGPAPAHARAGPSLAPQAMACKAPMPAPAMCPMPSVVGPLGVPPWGVSMPPLCPQLAQTLLFAMMRPLAAPAAPPVHVHLTLASPSPGLDPPRGAVATAMTEGGAMPRASASQTPRMVYVKCRKCSQWWPYTEDSPIPLQCPTTSCPGRQQQVQWEAGVCWGWM